MSKKLIILLCVCLALAILLVSATVIFVGWNRILLNQMTRQFSKTVSSNTQIEILDIQSTYGKLNGNGNGIQFYGAALVKASSDQALHDVTEALSAEFEVADFVSQEKAVIDSQYIEHANLTFDYSDFKESEQYYQIFFYCSAHLKANPFDIMGH